MGFVECCIYEGFFAVVILISISIKLITISNIMVCVWYVYVGAEAEDWERERLLPPRSLKFFFDPGGFFSNTLVAHPQSLIKVHLHYMCKAFPRLAVPKFSVLCFHNSQVSETFRLVWAHLRKETNKTVCFTLLKKRSVSLTFFFF